MPQYLVTVRSRRQPDAPDQLYLVDGAIDAAAVQRLADELLHDPVVQQVSWVALDQLQDDEAELSNKAFLVEVAYLPGVTDNEAESVKIGAERLGLPPLRAAHTLRRFRTQRADAAQALFNPLIQTTLVLQPGQRHAESRRGFYAALLQTPPDAPPTVSLIPLRAADDDELMRISRAGVLSLDLAEMRAVRDYFRDEQRDPTDGELETLAQTWSEHCSHKTFKASVRYRSRGSAVEGQSSEDVDGLLYAAYEQLQRDCEINSLIRTFLVAATDGVLERRGPDDGAWVLSAFVDNAGIIAFGPDHEVSIKVETHNHPSALEPFGGANTGVGGVVRDVLGVSAQPIANTDVLCFGPLDLPDQALAPGVLHPRVVAAGVVAGVRDYGNKLGIPTVNGAVLYDRGYIANPLVFCGTVGLAPRGRHPRSPRPGDAVVVLGGRTGRDGIHGATFSSVELTHTTAQEVGSAVQIGDPITEKKVIDVVLQARDAGLYSAITDCGAGGLSSAVGEMGAEIGAQVALDDVPLKYAGLRPWEIWLSEAQERMVLAVPPQHVPALLSLCQGEDVEATVIGHFTSDHRLTVSYQGATVVSLDMNFLHDGRPQRVLDAVWTAERGQRSEVGNQGEWGQRDNPSAFSLPPSAFTAALKGLLAHPNIASKAPIVRTYDHEVGGRTVIKPLVGRACDGPGDAAVLRPLWASAAGLALGCGINPRYGEIDPYWMALACVDEALRNVVAVGGDPQRTAILDNFCWGDPRLPDRMAGLVRAAAGCHDGALAFGTPFVSGKDSLNNEYRDADGNRHAIPPTLLVTALAHVPDIHGAVTMDFKEPANHVYLVGATRNELGGAHIHDVLAEGRAPGGAGRGAVPQVDLAVAPGLMAALHGAIRAGLVRACHDLSEGGLAVAAAEMAFGGGAGLEIDLEQVVLSGPPVDAGAAPFVKLFSETPTRFLVEVRPADRAAFEQALAGQPHARIGSTTDSGEFVVRSNGDDVLRAAVDELKTAWQATPVV